MLISLSFIRTFQHLTFCLIWRYDCIFRNLVLAHCRCGSTSDGYVAKKTAYDVVGLCVPVHWYRCVVSTWYVQRGINSFFVQFCYRGILDCCRFGCDTMGSLGLVSISAEKSQGTAPCADVSTNYRSSGHQTHDANITWMKTEYFRSKEWIWIVQHVIGRSQTIGKHVCIAANILNDNFCLRTIPPCQILMAFMFTGKGLKK